MAERGVVTPAQIDKRILREWGAGLYDTWQPATVRLSVAAVKGFLRWAADENYCRDNLPEAIKSSMHPDRWLKFTHQH